MVQQLMRLFGSRISANLQTFRENESIEYLCLFGEPAVNDDLFGAQNRRRSEWGETRGKGVLRR